ncbi:FAD-binding oxidoreductase [Polynucleobacter paneuropaeus]|nr:FAD-binding oxidoreductase [Polynucleobacter paneuropaeus]
MKIQGWGRYPSLEAEVLTPSFDFDCERFIKNRALIPRGLGRSYGDSSLNSFILETSRLDHFISFNDETGLVSCQAGVSIREILNLVIPKGWFVPVTPGTSFVTLGGAIASDVHGKNHHIGGSFSQHVISFDLLLGNGEKVTVTPFGMPDLFKATCGGMGLTGIILSATFQLIPIQSSSIDQRTIRANSLEEVCELFEANALSTYSVAWIDCLAKGRQMGRSLLMLGEHSVNGSLELGGQPKKSLPIDMPNWVLNPYSIKAFNFLYFYKSIFSPQKIDLPYQPYFYPLDAINNWNRLYGKNGFIQYQFVVPKAVGVKGLKRILDVISKSNKGSFLAVLKVFGRRNENYLSFPMEGYSLALDFKIEPGIVDLVKRLDSMVLEMGGRVYLTKDALMSEQMFKSTYPQWQIFEEVRAKYGAIGRFASNQSRRLGLQ